MEEERKKEIWKLVYDECKKGATDRTVNCCIVDTDNTSDNNDTSMLRYSLMTVVYKVSITRVFLQKHFREDYF